MIRELLICCALAVGSVGLCACTQAEPALSAASAPARMPDPQERPSSAAETMAEPRKIPQEVPEEKKRDFLPGTEQQLAAVINVQRDIQNLAGLTVDPGLTGAARLRAMEIAKAGKLSHRRPDGSVWVSVLENEFPVACSNKGESICRLDGSEGRRARAQDWYDQLTLSPSQTENLLFPGFNRMGVGLYYEQQGDRYQAVAVVLLAQAEDEP